MFEIITGVFKFSLIATICINTLSCYRNIYNSNDEKHFKQTVIMLLAIIALNTMK